MKEETTKKKEEKKNLHEKVATSHKIREKAKKKKKKKKKSSKFAGRNRYSSGVQSKNEKKEAGKKLHLFKGEEETKKKKMAINLEGKGNPEFNIKKKKKGERNKLLSTQLWYKVLVIKKYKYYEGNTLRRRKVIPCRPSIPLTNSSS